MKGDCKMKKKPTNEIPEFQAKHHLPKTQFPFDEKISVKEKRTHILKGVIGDLNREKEKVLDERFSPREFFEKQAPRSKKLDRERDYFQSKIPIPKPVRLLTPSQFSRALRDEYEKKEFAVIDPKLRQFEIESYRIPNLDENIDINNFLEFCKKNELSIDKKIYPYHYLIRLAVYYEILDFHWLIESEESMDNLPFWEGAFLAYHHCIAYDELGRRTKPPINIVNPKTKKEELEDFLNYYPDLRLNSVGDSYSQKVIKKYKNGPPIIVNKKKFNILRDLPKYPLTYKSNKDACELYLRIMGNKGTLQDMIDYDFKFPNDGLVSEVEYLPFKQGVRPGFIHFLVEFTGKINQREKYKMAYDFLGLYLGITAVKNPDSIKRHLQ
jgi:hypothetical protein